VDLWLDQTRYDKGVVLPVETVWRLAKAWYVDPRKSDWRPRTREESQSVLESVGLTDPFWAL
jgi:hypothetical protein